MRRFDQAWGTLNAALWAADEHKLDGVGKVFHDDNPEEEDDLIGVDLDRVRDKDTGEVAGWAMNIVERFETYAEVSPSGTGIKLWIFGKLPGERRRNDAVGVEVYFDKRFFTVTGERLPQAPKRVNRPASELLEALYMAVFGEPTDGNGAGKPTTRRSPEMADQKIMAMLRSDAGAERFAAAYDDGDITAWADNQSSADWYLAKRIAFYTQDPEQVERIFGGSALARRPKWTDREDYRERTIMGAISSLKEIYQPKREVDDRPGVEILRDRMLGRVKGKLCYSMGAWQEYGHGVWRTVREDRALSMASDVIEEAVPEGIKYSWHLVTGVASAARLKLGVSDEVWDSEPDRLAFTNGALDLRTFEFSEHSPDHYTTAGVPYDYDPDATGPMWDRYVRYLRESLDPETAGFIQEYLGYCLTAETDEEKMLFLVGPRGSGKSTLIEGVEAMLGPDLSTTRSLDGLQERFGRVGIVGKRVIVSKEMKALNAWCEL
jgi:putative DNA primase/helicase